MKSFSGAVIYFRPSAIKDIESRLNVLMKKEQCVMTVHGYNIKDRLTSESQNTALKDGCPISLEVEL